jgi:AcrR family transcriptional regulator
MQSRLPGEFLRIQKKSMKTSVAQKTTRKPRADAQRNRERILEVAKRVFMRRGGEASMDEIAKGAKIGPGTLYRHFPTRDDLLAAVYINEVEKLAEAQRKFSAELPPVEALRAWMLNAMAGGPSRVFQQTSRPMEEAANALARRAVANGDLRPDVDPMDMLRAIYGVSSVGSTDDWLVKAQRFVEILIQGSRS